MELFREKQTEFLRRPEPESVLRCPKCHSVFIENNVCESCSYRLDFDVLGDPLGAKSYFQMMDEYLTSKPIVLKLIPALEKLIETSEKREFVRKLLFRFDMLLEHINEYAHDRDKYKLYVFECEEILKELKRFKCEEELLDKKLELTLGVTHPLYQKLIAVVLDQGIYKDRSDSYKVLRAAASFTFLGILLFILFIALKV